MTPQDTIFDKGKELCQKFWYLRFSDFMNLENLNSQQLAVEKKSEELFILITINYIIRLYDSNSGNLVFQHFTLQLPVWP